ncbi:FtsX-like permease family protein [Segetibacter sp. 3557_3]|uniref:ABC transporter permease n=1 Tax=Segetibacter sp. 3557_3 TaxID=2547429 RepID=UPI001059196C|nr:FtsX-like permease family protein [Segetibacter sp. 3557_3]TDH21650.1 FtsX-like permease family protein [Segetibacter sp. 3557_3]
MLRNYFKIAIAVLKRRKFFTFISLFGISFTLTIMMVVTAFIDDVFSSGYPDYNRDRTLYVNSIKQVNTKKGHSQMGPASYHFFDYYVGQLKTPAMVAVSTNFSPSNTYVNNKKLVINLKYTNADYWNVLQYRFVEGKPYQKEQVDRGEKVAVISTETKDSYFGSNAPAVGKYIETDNVCYRVIGVVDNVPVTRFMVYGDMYLPYTVSKADYRAKTLMGSYTGILMAKSAGDVEKMQEEFSAMARRLPTDRKELDKVIVNADHYLASFTRQVFGNAGSTGLAMFFTAVGLFTLLFMLLPTLNLVNINISRIMERSSEIGVRKAFGASSSTLVYQFIIENIILTILGGILGVIFSYIVLQIFNSSNLLANVHLSINLQVLLYSLIACIVFGLLSGVYPAWRMSRLHVVTALKA